MKTGRSRWLHISDLRCPGGNDPSWERSVSAALMRVHHVASAWGGFDFVLVSGDLSRTGETDELDRAKRLLDEITKRLARDGVAPFVLAVPGRRDALNFENWDAWWSREVAALPYGVTVRRGPWPGDFVATISLQGTRIGVVGLGAARGEETFAGEPARIEERVRALCVDPSAWARHHHVALVAVNDAGTIANRYALPTPTGAWKALKEHGFEVIHAGRFKGAVADPMVLDRGVMVAQAMSFSGAGEPYGREADTFFPQGGVVVELELAVEPERPSLLTAWSYTLWRDGAFLRDEDGPARREPVYRSEIPAPTLYALPGGMVAPMERSPRPVEAHLVDAGPVTSDLVVALLDSVLPDEADFDGFVLDQLRGVYNHFERWMNRRQRTEFIIETTGINEVVAALRRYLPDTTAERLAELRAAGYKGAT